MSKETTVFRIFLASPSDVAEERQLLDKVVSEQNRSWSDSLGVTIELLKWETDVHPSVSTDAQAVINEQIDPNYDAFVGIFWNRIGAPTPRAISGSIEEFDRAYSKWQQNNKSPEIMIYFKDGLIAPSKIDNKQHAAVQEFKHSLKAKGCLYSIFEDTYTFESSIRAHLSVVVQKFAALKKTYIPANLISKSLLLSAESVVDVEDYDQSDYFAIFLSRNSQLNTAYLNIAKITNEFANNVIERTKKLNTSDKSEKIVEIITTGFANDLKEYAHTLSMLVVTASKSRKIGFNALSKAISMPVNFVQNESSMMELRTVMKQLELKMGVTRNTFNNMHTVIKSLPAFQNDLVISQKFAVEKCEQFIIEIESARNNLLNIIMAIDKLIEINIFIKVWP